MTLRSVGKSLSSLSLMIKLLGYTIVVMLVLTAELYTGFSGKEAQMTLNEGQKMNHSTFPGEVELAVIEASGDGMETVHAIPQSSLKDGAAFPFPGFTLHIDRYFAHSEILDEKIVGDGFDPIRATAGAGIGYAARAMPKETRLDRENIISAFVSILPDNGSSSGRWLLTNAISSAQSFEAGGKSGKLIVRQARLHHPFSIQLLERSHNPQPSSKDPKHFSSKIRLLNPTTGEDREVLISIKQPLKYQGLTFYPSGSAADGTTTLLKVVKKPAFPIPYISCAMVSVGLLWLFFTARARRKSAAA
jgi:hypothetical protein